MTDDRNILNALCVLHERFVEEPTEQKAVHIIRFVGRSKLDVTPPIWDELFHYVLAVSASQGANFSPASLTHVKKIAEECLG